MQLGSLFFSVGFKSTGTDAAQKFESVQAKLAQTTDQLTVAMQQMADMLSKIAVKLGAVTEEEIQLNKAQEKSVTTTEDHTDAQKEFAKQTDRGQSLYGVFFEKLKNSVGVVNAVRLQLVGLGAAMTYLAKKSSDIGANLLRFSQLTGLSTDKLQELEQQAAASGISTDEVANALKSLQETSTNLMLGQGDAHAWQLLGLAPGQDPFKQLEQLQKASASMSAPMFTTLAKSAGFSEDMITFLHEIKDMPPADKNLIFSEKEIKNLKTFDVFFNRATNNFQLAMKKLGAALIPVVRPLLDSVGRWAWGISRISDLISNLSDRFRILGMVLAAIGAGVAAYFFPITAAITAAFLILDDFFAYLRGDDSLIGDALGWLTKAFDKVGDAIGATIERITGYFKNAPWMMAIKDIWQTIQPFVTPGNQLFPTPTNVTSSGFNGQPSNITDSSNKTFNINIDGSKSPIDTAKAIKKEFNMQNNNAVFSQPVGSY